MNQAIEELIGKGQDTIGLCLLPGEHVWEPVPVDNEDPFRRIRVSIRGCCSSTRIIAKEHLSGWP